MRVSEINGTHFLKLRKELGLTQTQLGAWLGVGSQTILRYENGKFTIPKTIRILVWMLWEQEINKNPNAVKDYLHQIRDVL